MWVYNLLHNAHLYKCLEVATRILLWDVSKRHLQAIGVFPVLLLQISSLKCVWYGFGPVFDSINEGTGSFAVGVCEVCTHNTAELCGHRMLLTCYLEKDWAIFPSPWLLYPACPVRTAVPRASSDGVEIVTDTKMYVLSNKLTSFFRFETLFPNWVSHNRQTKSFIELTIKSFSFNTNRSIHDYFTAMQVPRKLLAPSEWIYPIYPRQIWEFMFDIYVKYL